MNDEEFLEDRRRALKESIEHFSAKHKSERERWVCSGFLENLDIAFDEAEVALPDDEPPDVVFRDARFEIKEILDPGRRRHAEYKALLQKALGATDPQELLEQFAPKDITPVQIGERIVSKLRGLEAHYAPAVRAKLDLLFYVNLQDHFLKVEPMPPVTEFAPFGWRSVVVLMGWGSLVLFAAPDAPSFLCSRVGTLSQRRFE